MLCDIYSTGKKDIYVILRHQSMPVVALPVTLLTELGELKLLKTKDIIENAPMIGAVPKQIIDSINQHGYALQNAEIKSVVSELGAALGAGVLAASLGATLPIAAVVSTAAGIAAYYLKDQEKDGD